MTEHEIKVAREKLVEIHAPGPFVLLLTQEQADSVGVSDGETIFGDVGVVVCVGIEHPIMHGADAITEEFWENPLND